MHKFLTGAGKDTHVDHEDHNGLNNRSLNLRVLNPSQNTENRRGKNTNNKSGYRNVCWLKDENRYVVQLQIDGKNTRLGYFNDVDKAGEYAEEMRQLYYGEFKGVG